METIEERNERIRRLDEQRAERRADIGVVWPTPDDAGTSITPIEIGPGRGDLNRFSGFYPAFPTALAMTGGRAVSFARLFQSQPWVASAVRWMMTRAIRVPLKAYKRVGEDVADRKRLGDDQHPVAGVICNPYNRGTQADFVMNLLGPWLVHGNSVNRIDQGANNTLQIVPKDWRFCRPIMPFRDSLEGFIFDYDQPQYKDEVSIDQVLHIREWSPTGPIGTSPLQQLGITIQLEDAAQRWQRAMFANGARPPSAITMADSFLSLNPSERQQILQQMRADVSTLYGGPDNAGKPALLPPGLDWKPVGQTTVEADLINQRKITREEIAAVYQIPPPLLGILERATYSNIETQRNMTYTDCLGPPLILLEQAINAQLIRDLLQEPDIFVEFDFSAVLRGDRLQEIQALREAIGTALMTPNEARSVLSLRQVTDNPFMDEFFMPANNMQPIGTPPTPGVAPQEPTPNPDPSKEDEPTDLPDDFIDPNDPSRGELWVPSRR